MKVEEDRFGLREVDRDSVNEFLRLEWKPVNERMFGRDDVAMWDTQRRVLAAYENGELVGAVVFKTGAGLGKVTQIITAAQRRRQGIGRALMERVEETCRQEGCHKVSLKTYWNSEAQRFYQKRGYVVEGILRRDLHGVDMCQMYKFL